MHLLNIDYLIQKSDYRLKTNFNKSLKEQTV